MSRSLKKRSNIGLISTGALKLFLNGLSRIGGVLTPSQVLKMDLINIPLTRWEKSFGSVAEIRVDTLLRKSEIYR